MDTKLLSKVPTWNGDEDQWFEWSFAFRAYCVVSSLISSEDLERAAGSTVPLPLTGQSPEARVKSGTLYYLLVLLCTGKHRLSCALLKSETEWKAGESFQHDMTDETPRVPQVSCRQFLDSK